MHETIAETELHCRLAMDIRIGGLVKIVNVIMTLRNAKDKFLPQVCLWPQECLCIRVLPVALKSVSCLSFSYKALQVIIIIL